MNVKGSPGTTETKHPRVIYWLAICATLSGVLVGYDTGIINGAVVLIEEQFNLTYFWVAALVASTILSAAIFSFLAGIIADIIGRKLTIMVSAIVFSVGGGIMGVASGVVMLLVGRFIVGACIGIVSSVVPVYVSECAPADIRGRLITLNQLFITVGIMLSALLAACFQEFGEAGWRFMLGVSTIPGVAQFIFFFVLPESPRYQMMKGQDIKALNTLIRIRGTPDVLAEMEKIRESIKEESGTKIGKLSKMFESPTVKKALFIGCMLQVFQQLSGINTVIYYSSTILKIAGFDRYHAIWLSCIPATINFLATFIGLWAVESTGRKLILALSFSAIAVALCVIDFGFIMNQLESPPASPSNEKNPQTDQCSKYTNCYECAHDRQCGYCAIHKDIDSLEGACVSSNVSDTRFANWGRCAYSSVSGSYAGDGKVYWESVACPTVYSYFVLAGLVLVVLGFAPGAGPMPWTINAEIYPLWCRSRANSIATFTNWICNLIVSYSFLTLKDKINMWGTFILFACVCLLATVFVFAMVPETKDKSLEEVERLFLNHQDTTEPEKTLPVCRKSSRHSGSDHKRTLSVSWLPAYKVASSGSTELE